MNRLKKNGTFFLGLVRPSLASALTLTTLLLTSYIAFEPVVSRAVDDSFIVQQSITGEISFLVNASDVTMAGSIGGLTGGYASGTTYAVVATNDPDGYNMTIVFPYATTTGMDGNTTSSYINNYTPTTPGTADYNWTDNSSGGAAEFGYTVSASTTADLGSVFQDDTAACGGGGSDTTPTTCWLNASITPETILNRTSGSAGSGSTTTIRFKVAVPSNPSPALDVDTYTATATLTATVN